MRPSRHDGLWWFFPLGNRCSLVSLRLVCFNKNCKLYLIELESQIWDTSSLRLALIQLLYTPSNELVEMSGVGINDTKEQTPHNSSGSCYDEDYLI